MKAETDKGREMTPRVGTAADPQPHEAEFQSILQSVARANPAVDVNVPITRTLTAMVWKFQQIKANPNAFTPQSPFPVGRHHGSCSDDAGHSGCGHSTSVKEQVLARSNYLCECCGEWAHNVYIPDERSHVLAGNELASSVAVCRRCLDFIEEDPITGQTRTDAAEREAALSDIYGQGSDSLVFRLLRALP